jgi:hypothetical protein
MPEYNTGAEGWEWVNDVGDAIFGKKVIILQKLLARRGYEAFGKLLHLKLRY